MAPESVLVEAHGSGLPGGRPRRSSGLASPEEGGCPRCESRMQAIAAIRDPAVIRAILRAVGMPTDSPELSPVRREEQTLFPAA